MAAIVSPLVQHSDPLLCRDEKAGFAVFEVPYVNGSRESVSSSSTTFVEKEVCIVGMACRLPGGISSPSDLWDLLHNKRSAQCTVPADRYNINGFYHKDGSRAGVMNVDGGYFLNEDVRQFDNAFFGINNLEASYMDPQQRKLLEVVFECFEDAGVTLEDMSGTNTAVYVGNFTVDYQSMQSRDPDYLHRYAATGGGTSIMSNRISHVFNLQGPSLTLDTACSSSIYALHHAVTAIKNGDCDGAIVAGANLITSPEQHLGTAKGGFLSPTSACHTFDTSADGYARAEGVNAIYIRRLSSAITDKNTIHAVIRGTAINSNGKTPGITLPSATMQEVVVRRAYQTAGLDFADTDYIECHGTGTAVGDPIEVDALASCFTARPGEALKIGSVKTNLGHSEAASGLTSILKVALAFKHGLIPPTYGVKNLNPKLKLESRNMKVLNDSAPWPRSLQRASINSFGYGGANGHVILESLNSYLNEAPPQATTTPNEHRTNGNTHLMNGVSVGRTLLLPFSASSPKSLDARRQQICDLVQGPKAAEKGGLESLALALGKRGDLRLRGFVLATTKPKPSLVEAVESDKVSSGVQPLPFAFVFTGQGAQYAGMAKELLARNPGFLASIRELDGFLQALPPQYAPDWTLEQAILDPPATSKVNDVTRSQPLCTAIQISLVQVLHNWGVRPTAVIGHSSGEIAAAYAAGLLTESQAMIAAYFRGFVVGQMRSQGAMMAAGVSAADANDLIKALGLTQVRVACVNAPDNVTLSGCIQSTQALKAELQKLNKFARELQTGGRAYHSHMMAEVGNLYEELVAPYFKGSKNRSTDNEASEIRCKMYSTVGHLPDSLYVEVVNNLTDMPSYFRQNLEQPVQFSAVLTRMITSEKFHLVEIGPHSALKGPVQQIRSVAKREKDSIPYSPTLVRKEDADLCLKKLAGTLFTHGHNIDWEAVNNLSYASIGHQPLVDLPPYPWDYSKELPWHEPRASVDIRNRRHIRHELLGTQTAAGNGIDWSWRNIVRLSEMPWLKDHKLDQQVVLPGSAYMAMAIEALTQILDLKDKLVTAGQGMTFEGQSINISAPFAVPDDNDARSEHTELHTTMCRRKISTANSSTDWFEFSVSSWVSGHTTLHCTGSIRVTESQVPAAKQGGVLIAGEGYEAWSMGRWYEKSREEGLNFGPHFQSLTSLHTDGNRVCADAMATTQLQPPSTKSAGTYYAVHPVTLDACFQAAIMGGTAGNLSTLRAFVPVFMAECRVDVPARNSQEDGSREDCTIHTHVEKTGFSTRKVDCTLRHPDGTPAIDVKGLRMSLYTGKAPAQQSAGGSLNSLFLQRHPCLSVVWKPDISRLAVEDSETGVALRKYISEFAAGQSVDMQDSERLLSLGALLDLAGHGNPRMRVLEIGQGCQCISQQCLPILGKDTAFPRCRAWLQGHLSDEHENKVVIDEADEQNPQPFDVILIHHLSTAQKVWSQAPEQITSLVSEQGIFISRKTNEAITSLKAAGFLTLEIPGNMLLGVRDHKTSSAVKGKDIVILKPNKSSSTIEFFASSLETYLQQKAGASTTRIVNLSELDETKMSDKIVCVSLLEMEAEFLATIRPEDMDRLRSVTDVVTSLVWLIGANMLSAPKPDLTLSSGLSRALMLEQPSLLFTVADIGAADLTNPDVVQSTCENVLKAFVAGHHATTDTEFVQLGPLLHISRFYPDLEINSLFRQRLTREDEPMKTGLLGEIGPARLSIGQVGMTDTMHFQQISEAGEGTREKQPPPGFVDVNLKAISLNAKDIYTMSGRVETKAATTALDFAGVVSAVGPDVTHLKPGDRVAGLAPNYFGTTERVPVAAVHKMLPDESFTVLPTLLTVYSTALFALRDRARLRAGESVLIHAGAGAFGLAAIAMARHMGLTIYTTVGSPSKRQYLVSEMGVPDAHIFNSRDASFVDGIQAVTKGCGVDVVINSLVGDLMHASWSCIAPFGRFVEIGKRELVDAGRLDMHVFLKNATFTAFDLSEFFYAEDPYYQNIFYGLIAEVMVLYREGKIKPPPIAIFNIADITQAYRYFNNKDRIGKVVVSMENPLSCVPVAPARYKTVFDPQKSYLLVGCLGGLGRSLSRWMMSRGARKFVFTGRSGCDKPTAQQLVSRLRNGGATVSVVRGDAVDSNHICEAVAACEALGPIGGVVQAAMGLRESLFTTMPNSAWHTAIQPKWKGTWNIHNALEGHDAALDFFLLTSSLSGSCGTATESNYCAANNFLDAFAHWRRAQGKPAVSLGLGMISEVGYLHENPDIEALLLRKGIQPLNEDELLQVIDFGLTPPAQYHAHILTGLEAHAIRRLMEKGFDVNNGIMEDPRTSLLAASLLAEQESKDGVNQATGLSQLAAAAEWVRDVPPATQAMLSAEASAPTMLDAIQRLARKRFSNLILMPADQVDVHQPLPSFGVDSMLAAEFRTWFWNTFKVDVPYLDIVSPQKSLAHLAEQVEEKLVASWKE
ncbi:putative polyketide synthase [Xylaria digitata]|nr:putative polyketide synthase [Xylaria digitata]